MNDAPPASAYRGRFAPSPTGDLHFGSLVAAVGSYLQARSQGGKWLIRIEDIDPPREVEGSSKRLITDLKDFGLISDEPVVFQSDRLAEYQHALDQLLYTNKAFHCGCSRRHLPESGIYPGTCSNGIPPDRTARSIRLRTQKAEITLNDRVQGEFRQNLGSEVGDFIIRRGDGLTAYQLATVVDDEWQGITEIVRGADLLDSTPRQIFLQQQLGYSTPSYAHLPVVLGENGNKLSKRTEADPVSGDNRGETLAACLKFLGHNLPEDIRDVENILAWGTENWQLNRVPRHIGALKDGSNTTQ